MIPIEFMKDRILRFKFNQKRKNQLIHFNKVLPDVINYLDLEESYLINNISNKWISYVGKTLSVHSQPEKFEKRILYVGVDHSVYLNELSLISKNIISKINGDYGNGFVIKIKFKIKRLNWKNK